MSIPRLWPSGIQAAATITVNFVRVATCREIADLLLEPANRATS